MAGRKFDWIRKQLGLCKVKSARQLAQSPGARVGWRFFLKNWARPAGKRTLPTKALSRLLSGLKAGAYPPGMPSDARYLIEREASRASLKVTA
jgi:hypothetical protein